MALPCALFILRDTEFIVGTGGSISLVIYFCMIVVALCFLKAAYDLWKFSDRVKKNRNTH